MGILIKGMKKPKECCCCPCSTINMNGRWGKCNLLGRDYAGYPHKIYDDCPLVEIPPHGRLIDADKFMKPFCDLLEKDEHSLDYYSLGYSGLNAMINDSPTVVESEEQEHEKIHRCRHIT